MMSYPHILTLLKTKSTALWPCSFRSVVRRTPSIAVWTLWAWIRLAFICYREDVWQPAWRCHLRYPAGWRFWVILCLRSEGRIESAPVGASWLLNVFCAVNPFPVSLSHFCLHRYRLVHRGIVFIWIFKSKSACRTIYPHREIER